jgi:hypothetical protein
MRHLFAVVTTVFAALGGHHPPARPGPVALAQRGVALARVQGELTPAEADRYRAVLRRVSFAAGRLHGERRAALLGALRDVAQLWRAYTRPRALTLFTMLDENVRYLASHAVPDDGTDVVGRDGAVYRFFNGHGLVFHPLANVALLNAKLAAGDDAGAEQLAEALLARGVPRGSVLRFEYDFPFGGGRAPWVSGMAQAVAAQALARASEQLGNPALDDAAAAAFRAIPGRLVQQLPSGPWIKLYSFSDDPVLNAQLQAIVSLEDYAQISGDARATALATKLEEAATALLPRFDTGYWSLYSLAGGESSLAYHQYVITLLRKLAKRTADPAFRETADRFKEYETQPPVLRAGRSTPVVYPEPADGFRDVASLGFWLSKRSLVTLRTGKHRETLDLGHGFHTLSWAPGIATPGLYRPRLTAVDLAGNAASVTLDPVLVKEDAAPPEIVVSVDAPATVSWLAVDEGTPWIALSVRLDRGRKHRVLRLGQRAHQGALKLSLPRGRWHATLLAENSAGKVRRVSLGVLPRKGSATTP